MEADAIIYSAFDKSWTVKEMQDMLDTLKGKVDAS